VNRRFVPTPLQYVARVSYGMGQPPPLSEDGDIPIIRATNIQRGRITAANLQRAQLDVLPLDRAPLLHAGEILVVRSGAYTGDSALISEAWAGSAPGYDLRVTPQPDFDSRFLSWCLLSRYCLDQLELLRTRAAQPHLNADELSSLHLPHPPVGVQRRIADYLDTEIARSDALVGRVSHMRRLVHERRLAWITSVFEQAVAAGGCAPLWTVARSITSGPRDWGDYVDFSGERPFVRISNIQRDWFALSSAALLSVTPPQHDGQSRRVQLEVGDLVVSITADIGSVGVVDESVSGGAFNQHVARVRLDRRRVDPLYAAAALRTIGQPQFARLTAGGAKQGLSLPDVGSVRIPAPSIAAQRALAAEIKTMDAATLSLLERLDAELLLLEERRQALITAVVTGELEV
jgi:type I restriction enzyme S subunit